MANIDGQNLGIAFALVCLAGLCAPLGACTVLFMKRSHTPLLAASIALAAGVMVFISLTEVLSDSMSQVEGAGWRLPVRHTYIYLAFFGGVVLCRALDWFADSLMHLISRFAKHKHPSSRNSSGHPDSSDVEQQLAVCSMQDIADCTDIKTCPHKAPGSPSHSSSGSEEVALKVDLIPTAAKEAPVITAFSTERAQHASLDGHTTLSMDGPEEAHDRAVVAAVEQLEEDDSCGHLIRTSILVWLALSLHNLPEGLATMVGYISSPHLGVTVAVAIAIHNIPEGIALGVPVFFATGSRWKAIGWAAASGLAEPLGALIGLALQLTGRLNPVAMAIIMAVVAGVMTGIAFQELLPRALSFDPQNKYTTHSVFAGMAIMAFSLVLLSLWDTTT